MNNYKELIDRLTNGTDMPGYDEGDALDWYSHITDEAADAIKQLVAGRDELVKTRLEELAALRKQIEALRKDAFDKGWIMAAQWSGEDHLLADMDSTTYKEERDAAMEKQWNLKSGRKKQWP